jgi:hypothetical protein
MRGPPDQKSERAPLAGRPVAKNHIPCTADSTETVRELQARSLRHRFALGYCMAASLAPLIWGVCPR